MRTRACKSPRAQDLFGTWAKLAAEPFRGITTDGHVHARPVPARAGRRADARRWSRRCGALLALLAPEQRARMCFPVDSEQWRHWQNTELYVEDYGLRLDEVAEGVAGRGDGRCCARA